MPHCSEQPSTPQLAATERLSTQKSRRRQKVLRRSQNARLPLRANTTAGRSLKIQLRSTMLTKARLAQTIGPSVLMGILYWQIGLDQTTIQDRQGALFMSCVTQMMLVRGLRAARCSRLSCGWSPRHLPAPQRLLGYPTVWLAAVVISHVSSAYNPRHRAAASVGAMWSDGPPEQP